MMRPIKREFLMAGPSREQGLRPFTQPVVETMQSLPPELTPNRRRKRPSPTQASRSLPVSPVHRSTRDAWHNLSREETMNDLRMFVKRLRGGGKRGNQQAKEQRGAVVVFPPNYDDVTAVMGRADLLADDHGNHGDGADRIGASRPWTHYLLEEELVLDEERDVVDRVAAARGLSGKKDDFSTGCSEKDGARQDAGEASSEAVQEPDVAAKRPHPIIVEDEDKLQRGLAKIRALDVKLMLATREAVDVSRVLSERVEAARARLEDVVSSVPWDAIPRKALFEEHRRSTSSSEPPSPMTSSRTTMSDILNGRTTFLTDGGTRVHARKHTRTRQDAACGLRSGHTGVVEEGEEEEKGDDGVSSRAATSQRTSEPHTGRSNVSKTSSRRSNTLSTTKTHGRVAVDYVRLNAEQVGDGLRGHLTREEEDRYRQLVHGVTACQPVGGMVDGGDGGEMLEKRGTESTTLDENVATQVDATASLISSPHCSPHKNDCNAASRKGKHFGSNDDIQRAAARDGGDDDDTVLSSFEPYGLTREARAALDAIEERLRMLWASAPSGVEMRGDGSGGGGGGGKACAATVRGGGEEIRASNGCQDGDDGGSRGDTNCGDAQKEAGGVSARSSTSAEPVDHGDDDRHACRVANKVGVPATRAAAPISTPHSHITVTTSKTHTTPPPSDAPAAYEAATGRESARSSALTSTNTASSRPLDGGAPADVSSGVLRGLSEFMADNRERKQAQMRMRQIDAMLEVYRHNDPLSIGANGACTSVQWTPSCSRGDEDGDDDASEVMSDASRALTEHVIRSARRPIVRREVEEEVRRAVGALGRKPREDEREAVEGLLQRLMTSRSALDATVRDDDDRAERVRKSLQRTAEILKGFPTTACMHDGDLGSEGDGGDSGGVQEEHGVHGLVQGFSSATAVAAAAQEVVQL